MKITPERVLELADALGSGLLNVVTQSGEPAMKEDKEIWIILRFVAEVMQAEKVGYLIPDTYHNDFSERQKTPWHVPLIIKPEPPEV